MNGKSLTGKKTLPLVILVVLAAVVGVYGYLTSGEPHKTDRYYWDNPGGPVMFEHRAHFDMSEACADCHHDVVKGEVGNKCSDCHGDDFNPDDFDHADLMAVEAHDCGHCHMIDESMPIQSCRDCHPATQENEPGIVACPQCHDDEYTADLMSHDEMLAIEGHTCGICHVVRSVGEVYHEQCDRCHERENPDLFVDEQGNSRCNRCHLK